jgi:hypothetical protein
VLHEPAFARRVRVACDAASAPRARPASKLRAPKRVQSSSSWMLHPAGQRSTRRTGVVDGAVPHEEVRWAKGDGQFARHRRLHLKG